MELIVILVVILVGIAFWLIWLIWNCCKEIARDWNRDGFHDSWCDQTYRETYREYHSGQPEQPKVKAEPRLFAHCHSCGAPRTQLKCIYCLTETA